MNFFSAIWNSLKWFGRLFTSNAAKAALELVNAFLPQVMPIVSAIQALVPNVGTATLADIYKAYQSFGVTIGEIKENPVAFGQALAALALAVVRQQLKDNTTPSRIINAAIELALVGLKAK
jgi:translation elongation factor EF-1beta